MTQPNPFPAYPLNNAQNPPPRKFLRRIFGWLLFLVLAVVLLLLLRSTSPHRQLVSLSEFRTQLLNSQVYEINLDGDEITGLMTTQATQTGTSVAFDTALPTGTSSNWTFTDWLLTHSGNAKVTVDNHSNLLLNILVPLIPWLVIFAFIWFLLSRKLKNQPRTQPAIPQIPTGAPFAAWVYPYQPGAPPTTPVSTSIPEARTQ